MGRPVRLTEEERRASNAARQRLWRRRHEGFARIKEKNAWVKRKAIREAVAPNENPKPPNGSPNVWEAYGEVRCGGIEGVGVVYGQMEPSRRGGQRRVANTADVPRGNALEETGEERRVKEQLGILRKRQAAGGLNAGVEVELEGI